MQNVSFYAARTRGIKYCSIRRNGHKESRNQGIIPPPPLLPASPMMQGPSDLLHDVLEPQSKPDNIPTSNASSTFNLRRTTRSFRTPVSEGSSRPLPTRRKPASSQSDDAFSVMSVTALKDLTTTNTARNQQYAIAKLETEVVRKQGVRPESPAVKVRTIVQRQMEKLKERAERAIRRVRRSDGVWRRVILKVPVIF